MIDGRETLRKYSADAISWRKETVKGCGTDQKTELIRRKVLLPNYGINFKCGCKLNWMM